MSSPNGPSEDPQPAPPDPHPVDAAAPPGTLDADVSALAAFLLSAGAGGGGGDGRELSGADLAALLRQLERADGVARGVESRLDELLSGLDGLLGDLGPEEGGADVGANGARVDGAGAAGHKGHA